MAKRASKTQPRGRPAKGSKISKAKPQDTAGAKIPAKTAANRRKQSQDTKALQRKPAPLTRKNLAFLGPAETTNGGRRPAASPSLPSTSVSIKTSTSMSTFLGKTRKNNILLMVESTPPTNLQDLQTRLSCSHDDVLPPSESEYLAYVDGVNNARNEATMLVETSSMLLKKHGDKGYTRAFNHAFSAFPKDCGFNDEIPPPQPDFVEGLNGFEFRPFPTDLVSGAVLYRDKSSIVLPHLAGEWKARGGNMLLAELQSAYGGAALVYARNKALEFIKKADPAGHAAVLTFITDGGVLKIFAHYAAVSEADDETLEYHQVLVSSKDLIGSRLAYDEGRSGLWNAQDHAKHESLALRDELKERWKQHRQTGVLQPITEGYEPPHQQAQASSHFAALPSGPLAHADEVSGGDNGLPEPEPRRTSARLRAMRGRS